MPTFVAPARPRTSLTALVAQQTAKAGAGSALSGNDCFRVDIYGNRNWPRGPLRRALMVDNWGATVLGSQAAIEFAVADGHEMAILFYDSATKKVNGYSTTVRVNPRLRNKHAIILSLPQAKQFFDVIVKGNPPQHLELTAMPSILPCIPVFWP